MMGIITAGENSITEYFCMSCYQLRLDLRNSGEDYCNGCGSYDIIRGEVGELDKASLIREVEHNEDIRSRIPV